MRRLILAWMMCAAWALKSMATKANVLGLFGGAAPGVIVTILCLISVADAQTVAPLRLTVPEEHPRIGITAADLDRVRGNLDKEPWAGLWKRILAKSEWVRREQLAPQTAFGGVGGQGVRFTMTEGLECVAIHALVGNDPAAAKALSDFFEAWDPAPLERDIADTDFMSSGEFFEGLAVVLDWTWDLLTEAARTKLRAIVERRARHNYEGFVGRKSREATIDANNHSIAFQTKSFPSHDFGDHPLLRATFHGKRWLGLTVLAPRRSMEPAVDVLRGIKGGELLVTVSRGGTNDELVVTAGPSGGVATLRVARTVEGKTVAEDLKVK